MLKYLFIFFCLPVSLKIAAQKPSTRIERGKTLAKKCIDCHSSTPTALADPLKGIRKKRTADYIHSLIKNPMRFADENKTAKKVFAKRKLQMPPFPELSKDDIKAILDYFDGLPKK
ncbi:MAG: cytochrome c [Ferruginibacter sp.]|nr:cytochrome c [Ferruginibacter sp.]